MSGDQKDGRALPPTDLFSAPSSLEHPATVPIVSATPLTGSRKQRLDDYVYPDLQMLRYPVDLDRFVVMCRDSGAVATETSNEGEMTTESKHAEVIDRSVIPAV